MEYPEINIDRSHPQAVTIAAVGAWSSRNVVAANAFHYCQAAQRDESDGFPYTAALEWRQAAELLGPQGSLSEHAWRQWERILQLPRRLAAPLTA